MKITDIITKQDLGDPYDRLLDFLELEDIVKVEQLYNGRSMRFKRDCKDLKDEYPELLNSLGEEKSKMIIRMLGDMNVYFPTLRRNALDKIRGLIVSEFNGYNQVALARKFGYTERHIRRIVHGIKVAAEIDSMQMTLDECEYFLA